MADILLTDLEERLAVDIDGALRETLRDRFRTELAALDALRGVLRDPALHARHVAARTALAQALLILDRARVG